MPNIPKSVRAYMSKLGKSTSPKKAAASKANGKLGGRPKKQGAAGRKGGGK